MSDNHSWEWAQKKLGYGERVRWESWPKTWWLQYDYDGMLVIFTTAFDLLGPHFIKRVEFLAMNRMMLNKKGWELYVDPPEIAIRAILFRNVADAWEITCMNHDIEKAFEEKQ